MTTWTPRRAAAAGAPTATLLMMILTGCSSDTSDAADPSAVTSRSSSDSTSVPTSASGATSSPSVTVPASAPAACGEVVAALQQIGTFLSQNQTLTPDRADTLNGLTQTMTDAAQSGPADLQGQVATFTGQITMLVADVQAGKNKEGLEILASQVPKSATAIATTCGVTLPS